MKRKLSLTNYITIVVAIVTINMWYLEVTALVSHNYTIAFQFHSRRCDHQEWGYTESAMCSAIILHTNQYFGNLPGILFLCTCILRFSGWLSTIAPSKPENGLNLLYYCLTNAVLHGIWILESTANAKKSRACVNRFIWKLQSCRFACSLKPPQ